MGFLKPHNTMLPFPGLADLKAASCDQGPINKKVVELDSLGPMRQAPLRTGQPGRPSLAPCPV